MTNPIVVLALVLGGCASQNPEVVKPAGGCELVVPRWLGAAQDYDRTLSGALLSRLEEAALADREVLRSGGQPGERLDAISRDAASTTFVAAEAAELATRLYQLECAVRRGTFAKTPGTADKLIGQIAADAQAARRKLASN
jgi:hypothetical protein